MNWEMKSLREEYDPKVRDLEKQQRELEYMYQLNKMEYSKYKTGCGKAVS